MQVPIPEFCPEQALIRELNQVPVQVPNNYSVIVVLMEPAIIESEVTCAFTVTAVAFMYVWTAHIHIISKKKILGWAIP